MTVSILVVATLTMLLVSMVVLMVSGTFKQGKNIRKAVDEIADWCNVEGHAHVRFAGEVVRATERANIRPANARDPRSISDEELFSEVMRRHSGGLISTMDDYTLALCAFAATSNLSLYQVAHKVMGDRLEVSDWEKAMLRRATPVVPGEPTVRVLDLDGSLPGVEPDAARHNPPTG